MTARGLLAELQRQARRSARERERQQRAAAREHEAALRRAEQARKADERARAKAARAAELAQKKLGREMEAERKRLEKEAKAAHVEAMEARVDELNAGLAETYDEIDSLLAATLGVDDYVDLDTLRRTVDHPPFTSAHEKAAPSPEPIPKPAEPVLKMPAPPKGIFGRKKKHDRAVAAAKALHAHAHADWEAEIERIHQLEQTALIKHAHQEEERRAALANDRARYDEECSARASEVADHNSSIDTLIANLGYGDVDAVQEYVSIVLSNSVYPDHFPVKHDFSFDPETAELTMRALLPPPSSVPTTKSYKYTKSADKITSSELSQKARKERYSNAAHEVALRSLHEIFEADRRGIIKGISLEVGTETSDPATGRLTWIPFVAVAAPREKFIEFDLSAVVPTATLEYLGASTSKNPYDLVPADTTGIRRS